MAKFILIGGYPWKAKDNGKALCKEILSELRAPRIVLCYFARPQKDWEIAFEEDKKAFLKNLPGVKYQLEMARPSTFVTQLEGAGALFLKGGSVKKLMAALQIFPGWEMAMKDKTILGTSAGADVLVRYYSDFEKGRILEGLGLVPAKTLVHYESDYPKVKGKSWFNLLDELKKHKESLPVYALHEGEFVVVKG